MTGEPLVLVLADEPSIVRQCQRALEANRFQVVAVNRTEQAVMVMQNHVVDVILVGIQMPVLEGLDLLKQARQLQPEIASVLMTGYSTLDVALPALNRFADALVLKPFTEEGLVDSIKEALKASRKRQEAAQLAALRPLFDLTKKLFMETDPQSLQAVLVSSVCEYLQCGCAGLFYLPHQGDPVRLEIFPQTDELLAGCRLPAEILRPALQEESPILICREGYGDPDLQISLINLGFSSLMVVPVSKRQEQPEGMADDLYTGTQETLPDFAHVYGTGVKKEPVLLVAIRFAEDPCFRATDRDLFAMLARQAALAIENAWLYSQLRNSMISLQKSQQALIRAEKLAAIGRLTAMIAHEVNNPLQSVQNCLHLALQQGSDASRRQSYLELAEGETERLAATVQRLLAFYRPGVMARKDTGVNQLIEKVLLLLEPQLKDHRIEVECRLDPDLPSILVVPDQIHQVLLNLILNALEAMPDGGNIQIVTGVWEQNDDPERLHNVVDSASPESNSSLDQGVEIIIADNGPGIPPDVRSRLFEPMESAKENGTGLGLAVSYGIVTAHGGTLELVESSRGACFKIRLLEGTSKGTSL